MTAPVTSRRRRISGGKAIALAAAVLVALVAVLVVLVGAFADDDRAAQQADERVTEQDYAAVELGQDKEQVLHELRPARPVDTDVLAEYQLREPETPAMECVYFESEGGTADDMYRFCFVEDRLRDKTVVLPPEDGVTGS